MPGVLPMTSRRTEPPWPNPLPASSPQMAQPKILAPTGRKSPTDFSPTSSLMKLALPRCSASPSGTVARSSTTLPTLCSPWRRTLPFVSASARNRSPRSRRTRFPTFPLPVRAGAPGRELVLAAVAAYTNNPNLRALGPWLRWTLDPRMRRWRVRHSSHFVGDRLRSWGNQIRSCRLIRKRLTHSAQNRVVQLAGLVFGEVQKHAPRDALQIVARPFTAHDSLFRMTGSEKNVGHFVRDDIPQNSVCAISLGGQRIDSGI